MYINIEELKNIAWIVTAFAGIVSFAWGCFVWLHKQKETSDKVGELEEKEETDIEKIKEMHKEDMKAMQNELCVVSYGLLAALDGLKQLGCNGEVTRAHDKLSKHLNQQAHDQI